MKSYGASLQAEKAKANVTSFWLVKIVCTNTSAYYYNDGDTSISYGGKTYQPRPLEIDAISMSDASPLEGTNLKIGNVDLELSSLVLNNILKNAVVTINEVWFDSSNVLIEGDTVYIGKVDGRPALDEEWCDITISPFKNPWTRRVPHRRVIRTCGYMLGDGDCPYPVGGQYITSGCSKTWEQCLLYSMTSGFGGFRFLPKRGQKFAWGATVITIK